LKTAQEVLANFAPFGLVVLGAMSIDGLLHLFGHRDWGRHDILEVVICGPALSYLPCYLSLASLPFSRRPTSP